MPKPVTYVALPTAEELKNVEDLLQKQKVVRRRCKNSKLLPFIATVKVYVDLDYSPQRICDRVLKLHSCRSDRKTMSRFIAKHDVLAKVYVATRKQTKLN